MLKNSNASYFVGIGRKSDNGEMTPDEMISQMKYAYDKGLDGCTIFHFGALTDEDFEKMADFK